MPIHDYRCKKCEHAFEAIVTSSSDEPVCPECGAAELEQLISAPAPTRRLSDLFKHARAQATSEGHFSNYSAKEKPKF